MQKLVVIAGPTAVGKSAVALMVAQKLNAEIVSADSVQVYRGLNIGSAKPTPPERETVPHHLLDIADPASNYTVADFQKAAYASIAGIHRRGRLPLLVGGTGLYIRAVVRGFAFTEKGIDEKLRGRLRKIAESEGPDVLYAELEKVDPETAGKLHPNDVRRVIRALEVYSQNHRPISVQKQQTPQKPVYGTLQFCLTMPREVLYKRIDERVERMVREGLVEEVKGLLAEGVPTDAKAMQSLGYKQVISYLSGQTTLDEAVLLIKRDTRRFAKRQLTWFRREKEMTWINIQDYSNYNAVAEKISSFLAGY